MLSFRISSALGDDCRTQTGQLRTLQLTRRTALQRQTRAVSH